MGLSSSVHLRLVPLVAVLIIACVPTVFSTPTVVPAPTATLAPTETPRVTREALEQLTMGYLTGLVNALGARRAPAKVRAKRRSI